MPFLNKTAWHSAQHDCPDRRRAYAHHTQGTHPSRKAHNLKHLLCYLNVATINDQGLLVVPRQDPGVPQRSLVITPLTFLPGIITALHLHFKHASKNQLKLPFYRHFFGIKSDPVIYDVVAQCELCNSLKAISAEVFQHSNLISSAAPGHVFFADVL